MTPDHRLSMLSNFLEHKKTLEDCLEDPNLLLHMRALGYDLVPDNVKCSKCSKLGEWESTVRVSEILCAEHKAEVHRNDVWVALDQKRDGFSMLIKDMHRFIPIPSITALQAFFG